MEDNLQQGYDLFFWELVNEIRNKLIYVITATILMGLIGWLSANFLITPEYESSINMIVNTKAEMTGTVTNDDISSAQKLVNTYSIIIKSNTVLEQVNHNLRLNLTYEELYEMVDVSAIDNTQVMKIAARSHRKDEAEKIVTMISIIAPDIVEDAVEAGSCKVVSSVQTGNQAVYPNVAKVTIIFAFLGFFLCLAVIILDEVINDYIIDDTDIENKLNIKTIGIVPEIDINEMKKDRKKKKVYDTGFNSILSFDSPFAYIEAYKTMRTNLEFISSVKKMKSILLTSTLPEESKSTTAINLAITLAEKNKSVVLVECDLRKPTIGRYLKIATSKKGLSAYLSAKELLLEDCVFHYKNFNVILSGDIPPNPSELLHQDRMRELIKLLEKNYDYVILDAPPVTVVTDAAVISNMVDGTLLIIRSRFAQLKNIKQAKYRLESVGSNVIGSVITRVDVKKEKWRIGYDYSDYGYADNK